MKSIFLSKTFWMNIGLAVLGSVSTQVPELGFLAKPETMAIIYSIANIVMRFFTKQPVNVTGN